MRIVSINGAAIVVPVGAVAIGRKCVGSKNCSRWVHAWIYDENEAQALESEDPSLISRGEEI
jgi:hypothetical protein